MQDEVLLDLTNGLDVGLVLVMADQSKVVRNIAIYRFFIPTKWVGVIAHTSIVVIN